MVHRLDSELKHTYTYIDISMYLHSLIYLFNKYSMKCSSTSFSPWTITTSWWFQPLWRILLKMGSSSPIFGLKIKNLWVATTQTIYHIWDIFNVSQNASKHTTARNCQRHFESSRTYPTQNNHQESTINNYSLKNKLRRWFPSTWGAPKSQQSSCVKKWYFPTFFRYYKLMTILSLLQHLVSHLNPEAGAASSLLVISIFGLGGRG